MALEPADVQHLEQLAMQMGWELSFSVAPNPEYVGVTAGPDCVFVLGPLKLSDLAAHEIVLELDALERGDRQIRPDRDGDPRLH